MHFSAREDLGLADGVLYGPVEIDGKWVCVFFNADGSESAINWKRRAYFAKYLMDNGYITEKNLTLKLCQARFMECLNSRATGI